MMIMAMEPLLDWQQLGAAGIAVSLLAIIWRHHVRSQARHEELIGAMLKNGMGKIADTCKETSIMQKQMVGVLNQISETQRQLGEQMKREHGLLAEDHRDIKTGQNEIKLGL